MEEEETRPGFASESFKNLQFLHHKEQRRCLTLKNGPMEQAIDWVLAVSSILYYLENWVFAKLRHCIIPWFNPQASHPENSNPNHFSHAHRVGRERKRLTHHRGEGSSASCGVRNIL